MKTVIEGGATVQVTAQESDSDEEDDENVFNVKVIYHHFNTQIYLYK